MNWIRLSLTLLILQTAAASPQTQQQGATQERASLQGVVLKMGTGEPVSKATVILSGFEGRGNSYAATTNSGGQFLFQNLEPGQYRLSAFRNGYVRYEYGARSPNRHGLPIGIAAGQRMTELVLQIMPAGTLTGRVFDRDGEPLANATVQALKCSYQEGQRLLNSVQQARTNDLGEYRLFWLPPGQYFVSATYNDNNRNGFPVGPAGGTGNGVVIAEGAVVRVAEAAAVGRRRRPFPVPIRLTRDTFLFIIRVRRMPNRQPPSIFLPVSLSVAWI